MLNVTPSFPNSVSFNFDKNVKYLIPFFITRKKFNRKSNTMTDHYPQIPPELLLQCPICNSKFKKEEIDDFLGKHTQKSTHIKQKLLQIQHILETSQSLADFNISMGIPCCKCLNTIIPPSTKKDKLISALFIILFHLFFLYLLFFRPIYFYYLPWR